MNRLISTLTLAALVAACGSPAPADGDPVPPTTDAGTDSAEPQADAPPTIETDAGPAVDSQPPLDTRSSEPDALPPTVDAGRDADATTGPIDAAVADRATPVDAGGETSTVDAAADSDGGVRSVCPSPIPAGCQHAYDSDALVRATFPQPCGPQGDKKCGGVYRSGVVETLPIWCDQSMWRLDGYWNGASWLAGHTCSTGCANGTICNP